MILYKTCVGLGGSPRSGDSLYMLGQKIEALSGVDMTAPWLPLFRSCQAVGGNPNTSDSIYMLLKKIAGVLISGGSPTPTGDIETFAGVTITTFGGEALETF